VQAKRATRLVCMQECLALDERGDNRDQQ